MPPSTLRSKIIPLSPQGLAPDRALPFVCLGSACPSTCCGPFHGTRALEAAVKREDLGAIVGEPSNAEATTVSVFAEIRLTDADVERLQGGGLDGLIVRRETTGGLAYYMKLRPDGTCSALADDGLCSIHAERPTLCRAFPFYLDLFAGLSLIASCPGVGAGQQTVAELKNEIDAAGKMYEFWLDQIR